MVGKPSVFEKATSSLGTTLAAAATPAALLALASESPGVLVVAAAAMIPPLVDSLPAQRQKQRVEQWQKDVTADLELLKVQIQQLTDEQYQLINEVVGAASQTVSAEKLSYLRAAVRNTILMKEVASQEASLLSRIVRDISAHEADFVCRSFGSQFVFVGKSQGLAPNSLHVDVNSEDSLIVLGLVGLGFLEPVQKKGGNFGGGSEGTYFSFSRLASKLITLLSVTSPEKT